MVRGIDHCPGVAIENVTTTDMRNHGEEPIVFHLGRDPGERFPLGKNTKEYRTVIAQIQKIVEEHKKNLVLAKPQLEWCDPAVMNWAPPGCEEIGKCQKIPESKPDKCFWPH